MKSASPSHLVIGTIVGARGLDGEMRVNIETDRPERFYDLKDVCIGPEKRLYHVARARLFKGQALLVIEGISLPEQAERLRGQELYVSIEDAYELGENEYYVFELEGMDVISDERETLGTLTEVLSTGANDVYVVRGERGEILLPAIKDVILDVNTQDGIMTVHLLPGLV